MIKNDEKIKFILKWEMSKINCQRVHSFIVVISTKTVFINNVTPDRWTNDVKLVELWIWVTAWVINQMVNNNRKLAISVTIRLDVGYRNLWKPWTERSANQRTVNQSCKRKAITWMTIHFIGINWTKPTLTATMPLMFDRLWWKV